MIEDDILNIDWGNGVAVPVRLLGKESVGQFTYWTCLMGETPLRIEEEALYQLQNPLNDEYEVMLRAERCFA